MSECVGCGYCCMKTPCDVSRRLYPGATICPQLLWNEAQNRYVCGLMTISGPLGQDYRKELHCGAGCCCGLNSWRQDVKKRHPELNRAAMNPLPDLLQMFLRALSGEFISGDTMYLAMSNMKAELEQRKYDPEEIQHIMKNMVHAFDNNRTSMSKGFMG